MHRIERELDLEEARLRAVDGNDYSVAYGIWTTR